MGYRFWNRFSWIADFNVGCLRLQICGRLTSVAVLRVGWIGLHMLKSVEVKRAQNLQPTVVNRLTWVAILGSVDIGCRFWCRLAWVADVGARVTWVEDSGVSEIIWVADFGGRVIWVTANWSVG